MPTATISALITNCSARKTAPPAPSLSADRLTEGSQVAIAAQWSAALEHAPAMMCAVALYCGRGVARMRRLASRVGAPLLIASAGLGLVRGEDMVPGYDLSVSPGVGSAVQRRIRGRFSHQDWWESLQMSRYARPLEKVFADETTGLVLVAVTNTYAPLLDHALSRLSEKQRWRLRLFAVAGAKFSPSLRRYLLPYDHRLDGLVRGAKVDFAQRAAEHFVAGVIADRGFPESLGQQHEWVRSRLDAVVTRPGIRRPGARDEEIRAIAAKLAATGVSQTRALVILRHQQGIACEQGRFRRLFIEATK